MGNSRLGCSDTDACAPYKNFQEAPYESIEMNSDTILLIH